MPRQNRVNPFGELIATDARGSFMGNRGVLHNDQRQLTQKRWTHQQWIICKTEFKDRKRPLMSPGCYTELFFHDEVVALAAGHRPCWECRRDDFKRFKAAWLTGNPQYGFAENIRIGEIDRVLHQERVTSTREKVVFKDRLANLPDGALFVPPEQSGDACLFWKGKCWNWSFEGYGEADQMGKDVLVAVLTPASTVNALRAGYVPEVNIDNP